MQFHLHAPAEHTIDGKIFDAVMHMVYRGITYEEEIAVVTILFDADKNAKDDLFIESLQINHLTPPKDEINNINVDLVKLFKTLPSEYCYHYPGSLTTDGYDEVVNWFIFSEPILVPQTQIDQTRKIWTHGNARKTQKLGSRIVHKIQHIPQV